MSALSHTVSRHLLKHFHLSDVGRGNRISPNRPNLCIKLCREAETEINWLGNDISVTQAWVCLCSWSSLQTEELLLQFSAFPAYTSLSVTLEGGGSAHVESWDEQSACSLGEVCTETWALPLTHCHCWKASDWNPQDGFCYAIFFFLSPLGQSSLEVFVEEDVTNNLRWGYHFSRQEETTKKKKPAKNTEAVGVASCIAGLWFCNWLFQVMSSPGVCWYFQASVVQTQPILFRSLFMLTVRLITALMQDPALCLKLWEPASDGSVIMWIMSCSRWL